MFEEYTYEKLLDDVLTNAPEGIDTRQGSIFYDAVSGVLFKVAKLYTDLDLVFTLTQLDTTGGEYLDTKAGEYGITRQAATKAEYAVNFTGTTPATGERFYADSKYFTLCKTDADVLYLRADVAGTGYNGISNGTTAVPLNNLSGLTAASFGAISNYGTDTETDDSLRARVQGKIAGASENGNKQHYKTWCESVQGVGKARITPLWNGPNTVKATLITSLGTPCSSSVVEDVQEYVDPADNEYTATVDGVTYVVGDGLGNGVANIGAHFTAAAAVNTAITLSVTVELATGYSTTDAETAITAAAEAYFKELALGSDDVSAVVRISTLGARIADLPPVLDYSNLLLNSASSNITIGTNNVPQLSEVTVNVD